MKQYDAVEIISKTIMEDELADALFLQGSLARETEDEYSNVDYYAIVNEENLNIFLQKRIDYLESYKNIIYLREDNNGHYKNLVCIFENGLCFNFYVTKYKDLRIHEAIAIVYDKFGILNDYQSIDLSLTASEFGEIVSSFCLNLVEFHAAFMRKDLSYTIKLANNLLTDLTTILRYKVDPTKAKLGIKGLYKILKNNYKDNYISILKKLRMDSILECVQMMVVFLNGLIYNLPIDITANINFDFYEYTKRLILSIAR